MPPQMSSTSSSAVLRKRPNNLDLSSTNNKNVGGTYLSALATARNIDDIRTVQYPEGVMGPKPELNANVKDGRFRYDRDFLLQFMGVCTQKPDILPPLDAIGLEPLDQASLGMTRGGLGRHRQGAGTVAPSRQASVGLGFRPSSGLGKSSTIPFSMGNFTTSGSKLSSDERFANSTSRSASVNAAPGLPAHVEPGGWAVGGGGYGALRPPPQVGDLSNFGKIIKTQPMTFGPSSVFAGKKGAESKREGVDTTAQAAPRPLQHKRLVLQPRSKPVEDAEAAPSNVESKVNPLEEKASPEISDEDAKKRIAEDSKELFGIRDLDEAEAYFSALPSQHHHALVDKLVSIAVESKEADAQLVADFFSHAAFKELCSPAAFEEGFASIAEIIDDIAIDAPKAFQLFAMMIKGADLDEERRSRVASKSIDRDKLLAQLKESYNRQIRTSCGGNVARLDQDIEKMEWANRALKSRRNSLAAISVARRHIDQDIEKREGAIRVLKSRRNNLAPISRLPPEILSKIFICCAATYEPDMDWVKVTHVSRHWRKVAIGSPCLWTTLTFMQPRWVEEMLKRSKMAPLVIDAQFGSYMGIRETKAIHLAMNHISRVRELSIDSESASLEFFFSGVPRAAPVLQSLELSTATNHYVDPFHGNYSIPPELFIDDSSQLRRLELTHCNLDWTSHLLKGLTHLKVHKTAPGARPSMHLFLDVLKQLSTLTVLDLDDALPHVGDGSSASYQRNVKLHSLTNLHLGGSASDCSDALKQLSVPSSATLKLSCRITAVSDADLSIILTFPSLLHLTIEDTDFDYDKLEVLKNCLMERYERKAKVCELTLSRCRGLTTELVDELEEIIADVIWDGWNDYGDDINDRLYHGFDSDWDDIDYRSDGGTRSHFIRSPGGIDLDDHGYPC